jgi:hypothetical protein
MGFFPSAVIFRPTGENDRQKKKSTTLPQARAAFA